MQLIITKALPYIFTSFGYGTWFFFACWMLIASAWAFFFLPETKGVTIEQMDLIFGYGHDKGSKIPRTNFSKRIILTQRDEHKVQDVEYQEEIPKSLD